MSLIISIHTPVKGVTNGEEVKSINYDLISIHTPVKGVTTADKPYKDMRYLFQSTLP